MCEDECVIKGSKEGDGVIKGNEDDGVIKESIRTDHSTKVAIYSIM